MDFRVEPIVLSVPSFYHMGQYWHQAWLHQVLPMLAYAKSSER